MTPTETGSGRQVDPQAVPTRGGPGCVLPALIAFAVAFIVIGMALFLPPFSLYQRLTELRYTALSPQQNRYETAGLQLVVQSEQFQGAFGLLVNQVPLDTFLAADASAGSWIPAAHAALPAHLALQSSVYHFETEGTVGGLSVMLDLPPSTNPDVLDVYRYDPANGWRFVSSQLDGAGHLVVALPAVPQQLALFQALPRSREQQVLVTVDITQRLTPEAGQVATIVAPAGLLPTPQGTLGGGGLAPGFDLNASYRVMPVLRNYTTAGAYDTATVERLLSDPALRAAHIQQIIIAAGSGGYDGMFIEYRGLPAAQRENFSTFIRELGASLDGRGLLLGVILPAEAADAASAYDRAALGAAADLVVLDPGSGLTPFIPDAAGSAPVDDLLRGAVREIERGKILLGLSALSLRENPDGTVTPVSYTDALAPLGGVALDIPPQDLSATGSVPPGIAVTARLDGFYAVSGMDERIQTPFIDYYRTPDDAAPAARAWLTTGGALRYRMEHGSLFFIGGVAFEDLLAPGIARDVLPAITAYRQRLPVFPVSNTLGLRWRLEGAGGVVQEVVRGIGEAVEIPLIVTQEGDYTVSVAVVGTEVDSARGAAEIAVYAPTATPTPLPTATPTLVPTITPTFNPATAAPPITGPDSGPPPPGSIRAGVFEFGGHVTSAGSERAAAAMVRSGMTWMKVQIRYARGMTPESVAGEISAARSRGFRVLLGVVGIPGEVAAGGRAYYEDYALFVAGLASAGADAIEIWNEPNLAREWPEGQIDGARYAELLRLSYTAIKNRSGSTIVISAAPAPTGAENAFPGQVVNDDRWLRQMIDAGGLNYLDCLGAHYNEGIVPPRTTSGDPRDDYYTRYLPTLLNVYTNLVGGARPICFTELGYLTPEGFPPLDPFFGWGGNTSVAEQAAWLADAAAYLSERGNVRLMIVWNVDFTLYGTDPQAGYAMLRPDGSCPACDAFAGAR